MKTFNIEVSEEQLVLIKQAIETLIEKDLEEPGTVKSFEAMDELADMSASIDDIFEEDDTSITYGLCY